MASLIEMLGIETGVGFSDIKRIASKAPMRYKVYQIPKRTGGMRTIAQPAREVKLLQRALTAVLLDQLPIHSAATAYRKGLSILDNAKPHAQSGPILKLDLKDFFPSIRSIDWETYCHRTKCLEDKEDILLSTKLLFRRDPERRGLRLAIGAPSSPILSNILMCELDQKIADAIEKDKVIYTRYADDMTFSAPRTGHLTSVISTVRKILRDMSFPNLVLNDAKTTYVTKKYHRAVTGLTLSNDGRVTIGRDRKRLINAMIFRDKNGKLNAEEQQILAGTLAYANAVEPQFLEALIEKYGREAIRNAQSYVRLGRKLKTHRPPLAPI